MHEAGLRLLVYVNPYIALDTAVYGELEASGGLVRDAALRVLTISFPFGPPLALFDPTSKAGRGLFAASMDRAVAAGVDGWMADYGEELPWDARLESGEDGPALHNAYPILWARTNLDYWRSRRPDGDFAFFSRSGHTGIAAATPLHWLGDQLTSFDRNDGLGSVPRLYLSSGLAGIGLTHSDVGGYTSFGETTRTFELWARWLELEAFTPFLRTHHTSAPADNLQWSSDERTLALFSTFARWHQRLFPYFATLVDEAQARGLPAVRPVWWGGEDQVELFDVDDELLVGPSLLLAPMLEAGATARSVRFPAGAWRRWRSFCRTARRAGERHGAGRRRRRRGGGVPARRRGAAAARHRLRHAGNRASGGAPPSRARRRA